MALVGAKTIFEERDADVLIRLAERALKGSMTSYDRSRGVMAVRRLKALKVRMKEEESILLLKQSDALSQGNTSPLADETLPVRK